MANSEATLTLTRLRATSYRATGRQNYLVQVRASSSAGARVDGMGISQPRGPQTGDLASTSWGFLAECLRQLEGRTLPLSDPPSATAAVRELLGELDALAAEHAESATGLPRDPRPRRGGRRRLARTLRPRALAGRLRRGQLFRRVARRGRRTFLSALRRVRPPKRYQGTLLGLEAALVDLVSRALQRPPAELVGRRALRLLPYQPQPYGGPDAYEEIFEGILDRVLDHTAVPSLPPPMHGGREATVYDEVPYLTPLGSNGTKGHLLEREALRLGLSTTRFSKGAFIASDGAHTPLTFKWSRSPRSSAVSLALCTHKEATRMRLRDAGVPVPKGRTFDSGDFAAAKAYAQRIGYPVVVKPATGVRGIGVVANIRTEEELQAAFDQLVDSRLGKGEFIVEQHIAGRDYRIVVVGDEVIAAILREPGSVEGDGEHTVAELMVNKNVARRLNPHLWGRPIKYGAAARYQLRRVGLSLASVPRPGQQVLLSNTCSLSQGGDSIDVLDELHPSIKDACVRAVAAVPGLWFCGVDFLIADHRRPLADQPAGICELNAHAAIGNCEYPLYGTPRPVARTVIQECVDHFGLDVREKPADRLALRLTVRGRVTRVGYRLWLMRHARAFGVTGWVRNLGPDTVEAVLVGGAAPASALAAAAVLGPSRASPTSVVTEHIEPPLVDDFQILEDEPGEAADAR